MSYKKMFGYVTVFSLYKMWKFGKWTHGFSVSLCQDNKLSQPSENFDPGGVFPLCLCQRNADIISVYEYVLKTSSYPTAFTCWPNYIFSVCVRLSLFVRISRLWVTSVELHWYVRTHTHMQTHTFTFTSTHSHHYFQSSKEKSTSRLGYSFVFLLQLLPDLCDLYMFTLTLTSGVEGQFYCLCWLLRCLYGNQVLAWVGGRLLTATIVCLLLRVSAHHRPLMGNLCKCNFLFSSWLASVSGSCLLIGQPAGHFSTPTKKVKSIFIYLEM